MVTIIATGETTATSQILSIDQVVILLNPHLEKALAILLMLQIDLAIQGFVIIVTLCVILCWIVLIVLNI